MCLLKQCYLIALIFLRNLERSVLRNLQDLFGTEFVKPPSKDGKDIEV